MDIPRNWRLRSPRYRLIGSQCQNCNELFFPQVLVCTNCKSREIDPFIFSGKGRVYSYSTVYQGAAEFEDYIPYIVALIDLDEGPRISAQLTDIPPEQLEIGLPVEKVVRKISEEGERGVIMYGYKFRPVLNPK